MMIEIHVGYCTVLCTLNGTIDVLGFSTSGTFIGWDVIAVNLSPVGLSSTVLC